MGIAHALGIGGRQVEARQALSKMEEKRGKTYVPAYDMALAYLGLGEPEAAIEWLGRALEERSGWMTYLEVEPRLDPLRGAQGFTEIMSRAGLR